MSALEELHAAAVNLATAILTAHATRPLPILEDPEVIEHLFTVELAGLAVAGLAFPPSFYDDSHPHP